MNIYLSTTNDFDNNGLGFLTDILSSKVIEGINDKYQLEMSYVRNGHLSEYLVENNIIKSKVADGTLQLFRIKTIKKNLKTIDIVAYHIFYDLLDNLLSDVYPQNLTAQPYLQHLLSNTQFKNNFNAISDISNTATGRYVRKNPVEAILGNAENSVVNLFGGEIKRDNFKISLLKRLGNNNGVKLFIGKNITGIDISINVTDMATRIMPVGYDGLLLPELYVDSSLINSYPTPKIKVLEFSDVKYDLDEENAFHTLEEAYAELRRLSNEQFVNGFDKPSVNVKIDWVELSKTNEYKDFVNLERVNLGDTITAYILGLNYETRVIKIEYNPLTDMIDKFEIGNVRPSFENSVNNLKNTIQEINPTSILSEARNNATSLITQAMGGFVYKTQSELFIMDTNDISTAKKVWRWNINGLGYSSDGVDGPYELAMTMDGQIVADFITSGKLNTNVIEGYNELVMQVSTSLNTSKTVQSSGETIQVDDAGEYEIESLIIEGKSEQNRRSGKNNFDEETAKVRANYNVGLGNNYYGMVITLLPNTEYTITRFANNISTDGGYNLQFYLYEDTANPLFYVNNASSETTLNKKSLTFTTGESGKIYLAGLYINNTRLTNLFNSINIQIEKGNLSTEYETYGISPSLDYPSEIESVGYTNLFDKDKTPDNYFYTETGVIQTDITNKFINQIIKATNKKYIISYKNRYSKLNGSDITSYVRIVEFDSNNIFIKRTLMKENGSVITLDAKTAYFIVCVDAGPNAYFEGLQIEEGSIKHSYIHYGKYGIDVKSQGKNFFDVEKWVNSGNNSNYYSYSNGVLSINALDDRGLSKFTEGEKVYLPNGTYCISNTGSLGVRIYNNDTDYPIIQAGEFEVTLGYIYLKFVSNDVITCQPMLEEGSIATKYEPYKSNTTQLILNEPLRSLPNGVKDVAYIKNNTLYVERKIIKIIFDGTEAWGATSATVNYSSLYQYRIENVLNRYDGDKVNVMSNLFRSYSGNGLWPANLQEGISMNNNGFIQIRSRYLTLSEFKNSLSQNTTEVIYELAEPFTEKIGNISILTFKGINYIGLISNLETKFELTYLTDSNLNSQYATKGELKVTSNRIDLEVGKKLNNKEFTGANIVLAINDDESSSTINADKISLKGKTIDLTSDDINISSNNFKVDKNGNVEANNFIGNNSVMYNTTINGGNIELVDTGSGSDPSLLVYDSSNVFEGYRNIKVGDNLNGATLYLSFPDNLYSSMEYGEPPIIIAGNNEIWQHGDFDGSSEWSSYIAIYAKDFSGENLYEADSATLTETGNACHTNKTEYVLPTNFGIVTEINDSNPCYQYIKIKTKDVKDYVSVNSAGLTINKADEGIKTHYGKNGLTIDDGIGSKYFNQNGLSMQSNYGSDFWNGILTKEVLMQHRAGSEFLVDTMSDSRSNDYMHFKINGEEYFKVNTQGITTPLLTQTSKAESKKDFEKYTGALEEIKNIDIYQYRLKHESESRKKHLGFVIGKDYKYSNVVTAENEKGEEIGVDNYSFTSLCLQAIKEQQAQIEELKKIIYKLNREE